MGTNAPMFQCLKFFGYRQENLNFFGPVKRKILQKLINFFSQLKGTHRRGGGFSEGKFSYD